MDCALGGSGARWGGAGAVASSRHHEARVSVVLFAVVLSASDGAQIILHGSRCSPKDRLRTQENERRASRREFLSTSGRIAAASARGLVAVPAVHAAENNTIKVALIGCGGRGTGAAMNALSTQSGPTELVAMADVFQHRLDGSL